MNILFISGVPPYPTQKADRTLMHYLARELSGRRYKLDLLCFYEEPEDLSEVPRYEYFFEDIHLIPKPAITLNNLRQRTDNVGKRFPKNAAEAWSPQMWEAVQTLVREKRYDLVQLVGGVEVCEYLPLVKHLPNLFVATDVRSVSLARHLELTRSKGPKRDLERERGVMQQVERWMYGGFDKVGCLTPTHLKALTDIAEGAHLMPLPFGVDADYYQPTGHEPRSPGLLFIGNFSNPAMVEAASNLVKVIFPAVKRAVPAAKLFIVGHNPPGALRAAASKQVLVTDHVPDLRPYFDLATVFISPLPQSLGIQQDVLKAMAMMTPVVATPASCEGMNLQAEDEAILANSNNRLAKETVRVLSDRDLRHRLQANGRKRVQESFTWQEVAARYEQIYQQIVQQHQRLGS